MRRSIGAVLAAVAAVVTVAVAGLDRGARVDRDRGDVPGWVMITVMSAVLVAAILGIFRPEIQDALSHVFDSISAKS